MVNGDYEWRQFSNVASVPSGHRPAKITPRTYHRLLNEAGNNPTGSAEDLQKELENVTMT